jgi:hypothetical protein
MKYVVSGAKLENPDANVRANFIAIAAGYALL